MNSETLLKKREKSLIATKTFDTPELVEKFPPKVFNENKKVLFKISMANKHSGKIVFSKYNSMSFPSKFDPYKTEFIMDEHGYQYEEPKEKNTISFHVNFADTQLFGYYGGGLFAQDELQVGEHPTCGSLREALSLEKDKKLQPLTKDNGATPCIVCGVEKRIKIKLDANKDEGRPNGLYGNEFRAVSKDAIIKATKVLDPPSISNIIAIEAPKNGSGQYSRSTITGILTTAYSGFLGAKMEALILNNKEMPKVEIHTGFW